MHTAAFLAVLTRKPPAPRVVYEVGSLNLNGSIRPLFPGTRYHGIDLVAGAGVDRVADGVSYVPPDPPDCVVCCEVLEHHPQPAAVVEQIGRVMQPGGTVIVTCAGLGRLPHSAVDGGALRPGEFYQNIDPHLLTQWLAEAGFDHVRVETAIGEPMALAPGARHHGDVYAVATR